MFENQQITVSTVIRNRNDTQFESAEDIRFNLAFAVLKEGELIDLDGFAKLRAYTYVEREDD